MNALLKISNGVRLNNKITNIIAVCLLIFVFLITVFSIKDDSLTMDELAHLPAGYSYLTQKDMRLNPEHPPLIKDLAAIPLLFINGINFPSEIEAWKNDINGQWVFGNKFLFHSGNPTDKMIFWGRIPMIFLLIFLGFFVFKWTRELFGNNVALLALFFYSFSPTFLAHGRLVTTDVGAAFGVVLAVYYFLKFLQSPNWKNIIFAGIFFGVAQLLKFSLIILYPFFAVVFLGWIIFKIEKGKIKQFFVLGIKLVLVFVVGFLVLWPVYEYHIANMPVEKISLYGQEFTKSHPLNKVFAKFPGQLTVGKVVGLMAQNPVLKPWSYYLQGVFMATERAAGGNTTYFMDEISAAGWIKYFPIVYLIKEPLAFYIFAILAILFAAYYIKRPFWKDFFSRMLKSVKTNFVGYVLILWVLFYWATSLISNLNIGVRHLLPAFPFTIMLVAAGTINWLELVVSQKLKYLKYSVFALLIFWQIFSVARSYPYLLAHFNELAGGSDGGYRYTVDSNLDWGQDLKRLKNWVDKNNIDKIYVDYFGGADAEYYLKEKYAQWWGDRNPEELPNNSYLAVSATFLQGGRGKPVPGFDLPTGYYNWLNSYSPVAKIGYSIFVYKID